jgi:nitric oxide reductase NorD protein
VPADSLAVGRYSLLASAIAGRTVEVDVAEPGQPTWTDGAMVFIDSSLASLDVRAAVVVQACLIASGSLASDVLGRLMRRPALAQRYLAIEAHRALAHCAGSLPPGIRTLTDEGRAATVRTPLESLNAASSAGRLPPLPAVFGAIRPRLVRRQVVHEGDAEPPGRHHLSHPVPMSMDELDDDERGESPGTEVGFDLSSPVGGSGAIGRRLGRLLGNDRSGQGAGTGPSAAARSSRATAGRRGGVAISAGVQTDRETSRLEPRVGLQYPEWDVHRRRYRAGWCTVREVDAPENGVAVERSRLTPVLRRQLSGVALGFDRRRRQLQGDEIDIDEVVTERVALVAGTTPSEAVYIDHARLRNDLAVLVLLDVSGSAADASITGQAVHALQREAAAAFTDALDALGDRVSLCAFRSIGRQDVRVVTVKRFDQRADTAMHRRLGALSPGAYTRLGAAIRHGAAQLAEKGGTTRRLLLVLSDGLAYDHGYGGSYGEADARRALSEARRGGTACLCISVGAASEPAVLRRVFGTSAHASVAGLDELVPVVRPLFLAALGSADAQRRRWTRTKRADRRLAGERGAS